MTAQGRGIGDGGVEASGPWGANRPGLAAAELLALAAGLLLGMAWPEPALAAQLPGLLEPSPGYYIVLTPSGLPYAVPAGVPVAGPAVWPYEGQALPPVAAAPMPAGPAFSRPIAPKPVAPAAPLPAVDLGPASQPPAAAAPVAALAPEPPRYRDGIYAIQKDYLLSYPENAWRIVSSPLHFDTEDWFIAAGVGAAAGAALLADGALSDFWQGSLRSGAGDDIFDAIEPLGSFRNVTVASLAGYGVAELFDAKREKAAALLTLESLALSGAITQGLKYATARDRPTDSDSQYGFLQRTDKRDNASFPSGHATHAFSTATVLSEVYGEDNPWVPYVAYPLATGVALSRINKDRHWLSDVLVGGAIGHFVGKLVTRYNPFLEKQGISVAPVVIGETPGVGVHYEF